MLFSQLMEFIPRHQFNACVRRYRGNHRCRSFSCYDQFLCRVFAQLTFRDSLRDIETCLRAFYPKLYHVGFRGAMAKSTLADANERRSWRIYADLAHGLIAHARSLYIHESFGIELDQTVYAFDSTTIDLCLTLFPWGQFRKHKSAVKVHTLLDLKGSIPCFLCITDGSVHDVNVLDQLPIEPGALYVMDRGYTDFARLYAFNQGQAFFLLREKSNLDCTRIESQVVDKSTGLRCDQTIHLRGPRTSTLYPIPLRRVGYYDTDTALKLVFLTNNFTLPALTIARLYKCRWNVELFFKWIKQHLRIKAFFGTSENAVKTQIWIAVCVYVLIAIVKKELHLPVSLTEIQQILSLTLFEKVLIEQVLTNIPVQEQIVENHNQLTLFDL